MDIYLVTSSKEIIVSSKEMLASDYSSYDVVFETEVVENADAYKASM